MKYMLFMYNDENTFHALSEDQQREVVKEYQSYSGAMAEAGVLVSGNALDNPKLGKFIRVPRQSPMIEDGPFADSKEHLGGYFIIDVPDLDTALTWAEKNPAAKTGTVEVRPVWTIE
ncbi:MAG: YciI family protein [Pseudomonadota bacterium]